MAIEVKLLSFYVEGDKLHITLKFPSEVVVSGPESAIAAPSTVGRKEVMACKNLSAVYYILKTAGMYGEMTRLREANDAELAVGRRMTPKKAAELLFPTKIVKKQEMKMVVEDVKSARTYADAIVIYRRFEEIGFDESNYAQKITPWIAKKYSNLLLFCTVGSDEEIASELMSDANNKLHAR